jgi:NDP-sugar pyrophosphorylase family protein
MKPMVSPTLLVLAAGMGSRYGGIKQIDPVGPSGETIMDYSIYDALRAGFGKVVFVIRRSIEHPFREAVGRRFEERVEVEYVFQELDDLPPRSCVPDGRTKPWGTAHAVLMAARVIREPFGVINADDFYGAESYRLLARQLRAGNVDYSMVGFILRNTLSDFGAVSRGVCRVDDEEYLEEVVELTRIERDGVRAKYTDLAGRINELSGDEVVSMNMWGFTPRVFEELHEHFQRFLERNASDAQAESYLPGAMNELVRSGQERVRVLRTNDAWCGVTYRGDRPRVLESIRRLVLEGDYPERLWG